VTFAGLGVVGFKAYRLVSTFTLSSFNGLMIGTVFGVYVVVVGFMAIVALAPPDLLKSVSGESNDEPADARTHD